MELAAGTVARLRTRSLLLGPSGMKTVRQVARWFGAMQSQDLASGKWSFGVRLPLLTEADIDAAIERGNVLRTWPMRGTLHFVPAEDARWMLETCGVRALRKSAARRAALGLDDATADKAAELLGAALAGGRRLARSEAIAYLSERGIPTDGQRAYHLLWYASLIGVTCIGPARGKEQTFVLLSEWANKPLLPSRDEALAILALRYFRSHGPASLQDFAGWADLSAAEAKRGIEANGKKLRACEVDGRTMWMARELADQLSEIQARRPPAAFALPGFDEFLLGIKDRSIPLAPGFKDRIIPGGNGMFMPTLVVDGVVVGTWKRGIKNSHVSIEPEPFAPLSPSLRRAFQEAFDGYARYLGLEAVLRW